MSMNMQAIRDRLAGLARETSKRKDLWKPKDKHTIRCLPYPHGDEPILELGFHYELGATRSLLCPSQNFGKECKICELALKLYDWNKPDGTEKQKSVREADFELFKKIQVKSRWYIPMVERGKESEGPKFYSFGKTIFENLLTMCLNEEMVEIAGVEGTELLTNCDSAFDLTLDFKKANNEDGKGNKKTFPITVIDKKMRPSKLAKTKKESQELIDKIPNMLEVYPEVSSVEVEKIFNAFMSSGAADNSDAVAKDDGTEYQANSAEKPVEGGKSIDEAFADLAG